MTVGPGDLGRLKVDWLTVVFPAAVAFLVRDRVSEVHGQGEESDRPSGNYGGAVRWSTGAELGYSPDGSGPCFKGQDGQPDVPTCCLTLSGSVVDFFTPLQLWQFIRWAVSVGGRCSRVDVTLDVFDRSLLNLADVHSAAKAGNFAGFKRHNETAEWCQGKLSGDSHTFGKRGKLGSGRLVQFYDKTLESKGEIDAVRMEARFSKAHGHLAFMQLALAQTLDEFASQIAGLLAGSITFIDRERADGSRETHVDRCPDLPWWARLKGLLLTRRIPVRVARPVTPLQVSLAYLRDTWAVTFALLHAKAEECGMDGDRVVSAYVTKTLRLGSRKLRKRSLSASRVLELDFSLLL